MGDVNLNLGRNTNRGEARAMNERTSRSLKELVDRVGRVDTVGIEERVAKYGTRSIKKSSKVFGLKMAVNMVDLTTLEGNDTPGKVRSLCLKALRPHGDLDVPTTAAVCVYPSMVKHAAKIVKGTPVKIASVATGFPSGQTPIKTRLEEVRTAVSDGADEIDMVITRGAFLAGEVRQVQDEISAVRDACGEATLKVILETSELETYDNIRAASFLAMEVLRPGDFIKTSTGKTSNNATLGNNQVMLEAIRDFYLETGTEIAMKPAGGILYRETGPHLSHRGQGNLRRQLAQQLSLPLRRLLRPQRSPPTARERTNRQLSGTLYLQRGLRRLLNLDR